MGPFTSRLRETFSHLLRVYLIDPYKRVRNIYSASFLHPDLLVADLRTLLLEGGGAASVTGANVDILIADAVTAPIGEAGHR